jgi:hypothetical protein
MDPGLLECEGSLCTDRCNKQIIVQHAQDMLHLIFYKQEKSYNYSTIGITIPRVIKKLLLCKVYKFNTVKGVWQREFFWQLKLFSISE